MRTRLALLLVFALFIFSCADDSSNFNHELELVVEDYFEESIPFGLPVIGQRTNQDLEASLGRLLFYDNRLSYNNSISCGSCHNQAKGFCDDEAFSTGLYNKKTTRNSLALVNNGYQDFSFWEGHRGNLSDHILSPISNHVEMGMNSVDQLVLRLTEVESYRRLFEEVYSDTISEDNIKTSLTSFVSSLISHNSKYDKGVEKDFNNFNLSEQRGKEIFFGKALCGDCHKGNHLTSTWRAVANIGLELEYDDQGAGSGSFKVPTLRNIEVTGPYMHDGRFETLEEVVEHYSSGVKDHPNLDWELNAGGVNLTTEEKEDLVEFLKTFTDYAFLNDHRFSDPFQ